MSSIVPLLTTDEVAELLRVRPKTVWAMIKRGTLKPVKGFRPYRFTRAAVRRAVRLRNERRQSDHADYVEGSWIIPPIKGKSR